MKQTKHTLTDDQMRLFMLIAVPDPEGELSGTCHSFPNYDADLRHLVALGLVEARADGLTDVTDAGEDYYDELAGYES